MAEKKESEKREIGRMYIWGTGRRKTAVARVRLARGGKGNIYVNEHQFDKYFTTEQDQVVAIAPLHTTKTLSKYDVFINVKGGGISGQAGAVRLGIARALKSAEPSLEPKLREEGLLTRDSRMKERKKYGLRGARRAPQWTKR